MVLPVELVEVSPRYDQVRSVSLEVRRDPASGTVIVQLELNKGGVR